MFAFTDLALEYLVAARLWAVLTSVVRKLIQKPQNPKKLVSFTSTCYRQYILEPHEYNFSCFQAIREDLGLLLVPPGRRPSL
jgi:hypothetical protein